MEIQSLPRFVTALCAVLLMSALAINAPGEDTGKRLPGTEPPADSAAGGGYTLVWSDEFDRDGAPDPGNWDFELGFARNRELQWYQKENARCKGGKLIIEGRRERVENPRYRAGARDWKRNRRFAEYTSSSIRTRGLHQWRYGRFEMRGRIDTRDGLWPAFWTLGSRRPWPGCGEIDIMEYYRGLLLANACWSSGKRWVAEWDDVKIPLREFKDPDWAKKFHIWRMDWSEDRIEISVDGKLLNTVDVAKAFNRDAEKSNPFREPHYVILNLAIGGTQGGDPSGTDFPARFEVDYVRVYQKKSRQSEKH